MAGFEETSIGFKTIFQKTFNETASGLAELATKIQSNSLSEEYVWLGNFPNMREWVGDRDIKKLKDYGYTLKNKLYESTVTVPNTHLEYDKIGLYKPSIEQMAVNAKKFPGSLVAQLLIDGTTNLCYDGKAFFAPDHQIGTDTFANDGTGELNSANLIAAKAFMMSIKNESGEYLDIEPNMIVCGPKNLAKVIACIDKQLLVNSESNPTYKMFEYKISAKITDDQWFLLDVTKPLKPFINQIAKDGVFEASNDHKFMKDAALFGTKSFLNAGYGLWQLAYRSTGV